MTDFEARGVSEWGRRHRGGEPGVARDSESRGLGGASLRVWDEDDSEADRGGCEDCAVTGGVARGCAASRRLLVSATDSAFGFEFEFDVCWSALEWARSASLWFDRGQTAVKQRSSSGRTAVEQRSNSGQTRSNSDQTPSPDDGDELPGYEVSSDEDELQLQQDDPLHSEICVL